MKLELYQVRQKVTPYNFLLFSQPLFWNFSVKFYIVYVSILSYTSLPSRI